MGQFWFKIGSQTVKMNRFGISQITRFLFKDPFQSLYSGFFYYLSFSGEIHKLAIV